MKNETKKEERKIIQNRKKEDNSKKKKEEKEGLREETGDLRFEIVAVARTQEIQTGVSQKV